MQLDVRGSDGWRTFADQFLEQRLNFYVSAGRGDDIIAAMQQVALERPDIATIPRAIGQAYNLMGQRDKSITYFEQALSLGDQSDATTRNLANIYLASEEFDMAEQGYLQILEKRPNDVEANSALAFIYAQQGRLGDAILHNQKVLENRPDDYDSLKNLAILHQQMGQAQQAIGFAQRAEQAAPEAERASWAPFIQNLQNQINAQN
jgi:tetratricopeptide (TPR) repeat protein